MKPLRFIFSVLLWSALVYVFYALRLNTWQCSEWSARCWGCYLVLGPVLSTILFLFADVDQRRPR